MHSTHPFKCSQCKYVYIYIFISIVTYIYIFVYLHIYIYISWYAILIMQTLSVKPSLFCWIELWNYDYIESWRGNVVFFIYFQERLSPMCLFPGKVKMQTSPEIGDPQRVAPRSLVAGQETVVLHRAGQRLWRKSAATRWSWLWYGLEACAGVVVAMFFLCVWAFCFFSPGVEVRGITRDNQVKKGNYQESWQQMLCIGM